MAIALEKETKPVMYNILIVDDNPLDAHLICISFPTDKQDCNFIIKENGADALEYLIQAKEKNKQGLPHFIISDINMPRLNGLELLKAVKADESLQTIPYIIYSGSSREDDINAAYHAKAACYIVKAFDVSTLKNTFSVLWEYWTHVVSLPYNI